MTTPPPSIDETSPEGYPIERKRTGRKRRTEIEETTLSKPPPHQKQTLLTNYCKKLSAQTSNSLKSDEFLSSFTVDRIKLLEQDLQRKEDVISRLKTERESQLCKATKMASEYQQMLGRTKRAIIEGKRQLAVTIRKERGTIDPKLGYFRDSMNTQFQEGQYLSTLRAALKSAQENLAESTKESKGSASEQIKAIMKSKAQFFRKQIKDLKDQLQIREKEVERYKQRIKIYSKELQCQLAKEKWPLLKNRYLPIYLIGTGGFGQVYKGFDVEKLCDVAIKISLPDPRLSPSAHENLIKHLKRQIQTHKQLQHPNIVRVLDELQLQGGRMGLIMEYCSGPQLKSYIKKSGCLQEKQARQIVRQLIFAVKYLHEQKMKVVHFDLKPANVIFHGGLVKIVDFGICKTIENQQTKIDLTSPGVGTYWYLPPEVFDQCKPHVSPKVDIWSIGVIFFEMLYGQKPFGNGYTQAKILREGVILNAVKVQFPPESPKRYRITSQAKDFIRACLKYDHLQRLSPLQAYQHSYISDGK